MSKIRKKFIEFIWSEKINISNLKEESNDFSEIEFKNKDIKNNYFILIIVYLFFHFLYIDMIHQTEYCFFNNKLNSSIFIFHYILYLNIYRNSISSIDVLDISHNIIDFDFFNLFFSQIANYNFIFKLNNSFERIMFKPFYCFFVIILYNSFLLIILIDVFKIVLNIIKISNTNKKSRKDESNYYFKEKILKIDLPSFKNSIFEIITQSNENGKLYKNNRKNYNYIEIMINRRNKRKKNLMGNKIHLINFIEILHYIMLLNSYFYFFINNKFSNIQYQSNKITLKIKGIGIKNIFASSIYGYKTEYYPNEVYINGFRQNNVTPTYNLNQTDNFIELLWYELNKDCRAMFYNCKDITEFDFSNFNTSKVRYMNSMFSGCSSLISLNLSNFDTSKVIYTCFLVVHC